MLKKIGVGLAVLGAVAIGVYLRFIRPWQLRWGATDEELAGTATTGLIILASPVPIVSSQSCSIWKLET